ncbi:endonuclease/exonuclease/phosphatase family protein [Nonlabens xiamenensis]|uniref:endonuclease/exonuclease/phosphatase family protein n=1 Tax=Nonlabens xiamenensis TaxID=2341043 RepID=UPI000F60F118|nr:endonuclease/exonuclease/phosphatase family protein [Nonlabens xiamenensis]
MNWRVTFQVVGLVAALLSLFPLLAVDFWWIRIFDFPHLLLTGFTLLAILIYFFTFKPRWINDYFYISVLIGCFIFQCSKIIDYTPFVDVEVNESTADVSKEDQLTVYTANVLQKNDEGKELFKEIKDKRPDVIVFTETNKEWTQRLRDEIGSIYPYKVEQPQENTYGMLVYSQLELVDPEVRFQVDPEIPSIHTKVRMNNGSQFRLFAIHPTPPMPQHNPMSTDRDQELMKTAIESHQSELPVIVMGDFNDVSWSDSTQLTKIIGGLLDLRIGRGFYNTYHANYPIFRWPLDHILVSEEWRYVNADTGESNGSDHFPTFATLSFEPERAEEQKPAPPSEADWKNAKDQLDKNALNSFSDLPDALDGMISD